MDLIDMQSQSFNDYKYILVYQDNLTKFTVLNALHQKCAEEVTENLLEIYLLFGAPAILQTDNGEEFVNAIIDKLHKDWPEVKIIHGKPRHKQSQGSVERANRDVEEMLSAWLEEKKTTNWSLGLKFVQFKKNRAYHSGKFFFKNFHVFQ